MAKAHGFHEKLKQAAPIEDMVIQLLRDRYKTFEHLEKDGSKGRADATCKVTGINVELKIDFTDYKNHFVERYSDLDKKKVGGAWQYIYCDYYVFYYVNTKDLHIFNPGDLVRFLESIDQCDKIFGKRVFQKGAGYTTFGYAIPKVILKHLEKEVS